MYAIALSITDGRGLDALTRRVIPLTQLSNHEGASAASMSSIQTYSPFAFRDGGTTTYPGPSP
jgi:hypothetical protein